MGYQNRRYRVVDGKLAKRWDGADEPGWFVTKADAWDAVRPAVDKATDAPPAPPTVEATVPPPTPTPEPKTADYETWKGPGLRAEIKARTGKGPKVGKESSKDAMISRLRSLDAEAIEAA